MYHVKQLEKEIMKNEIITPAKTLANKIEAFVVKFELAKFVKEEATLYCELYDQIDAAFEAEDDKLVDELLDQQSGLKAAMKLIIVSIMPEKVIEVMTQEEKAAERLFNSLVSYSIDEVYKEIKK